MKSGEEADKKEELRKVLEYLKLARKSHANLTSMLSGNVGERNVIEPLKRIAGWSEKEENFFTKLALAVVASGAVGIAAWVLYRQMSEKEKGAKE